VFAATSTTASVSMFDEGTSNSLYDSLRRLTR
jgi:hypothetical protein